MTTPDPSNLFTPFLPTTYNFPSEDETYKYFITSQLSSHSDVINDKKIGTIADAAENFNGEKWFYKSTRITRNGYQTICYIPSFIPMVITLTSTPKYPITKVNPELIMTLVYGSASKPCTSIGAGNGDYFSFMAQGDARIQFTMSDTQITITTDGARAAYSGFIVANYVRNGL